MSSRPLNILFLCTGNSARSLIAEGILRKLGQGAFTAYSAGSAPTGMPNPHALQVLRENEIDTGFAESKSWTTFAEPGAPAMDLIITVCDGAAGETCPIWPGHPQTAHWGVADPAAVDGDPDTIAAAFAKTYGEMRDRITALLATRPTASTLGDVARTIGQDRTAS
jgi:arsenate reductase